MREGEEGRRQGNASPDERLVPRVSRIMHHPHLIKQGNREEFLQDLAIWRDLVSKEARRPAVPPDADFLCITESTLRKN